MLVSSSFLEQRSKDLHHELTTHSFEHSDELPLNSFDFDIKPSSSLQIELGSFVSDSVKYNVEIALPSFGKISEQ